MVGGGLAIEYIGRRSERAFRRVVARLESRVARIWPPLPSSSLSPIRCVPTSELTVEVYEYVEKTNLEGLAILVHRLLPATALEGGVALLLEPLDVLDAFPQALCRFVPRVQPQSRLYVLQCLWEFAGEEEDEAAEREDVDRVGL